MEKKKKWTASEMGKKGAKSRKKNMTYQERSQIAKKAAAVRWGKKKKGNKDENKEDD